MWGRRATTSVSSDARSPREAFSRVDLSMEKAMVGFRGGLLSDCFRSAPGVIATGVPRSFCTESQ